jgi:pSer/pThr/pTyr-binding forkhead associated (FHA) protein
MEPSLGKLIVIQPGGPEKEYGLSKMSVSLGRAMTNDIILNDARTSRSHARLEDGPSGRKIVDLGSSNGTRVNGNRVQMAHLQPGSLITLGNDQLRFEVSMPREAVEMTMIDSEADFDLTLDREILLMSTNETSSPRLVIFSGKQTGRSRWTTPPR